MRQFVEQAGFSKVKVQTYGLKRISQSQVEKDTRASRQEEGRGDRQRLSHPFLTRPTAGQGSVRSRLLRTAITAFMCLTFAHGGDKLLITAHK